MHRARRPKPWLPPLKATTPPRPGVSLLAPARLPMTVPQSSNAHGRSDRSKSTDPEAAKTTPPESPARLPRTTESLSSFGWQVVMTFMATLEMARLKLLTIYQAQPLGSIYIARVGTNPIAPTVSPNPQRELPLYAAPAAEHTTPAAPPEAAPTAGDPDTAAAETAAETPETAETPAATGPDPAEAPAGSDPDADADPEPPQPDQP